MRARNATIRMLKQSAADDQTLVAAAQRGEAEALDTLIERYHAPLCAYLERLLEEPEVAREIAQETFLRMIRALPRYQPRARFSTWLYTIATNAARDEVRRRQSRRDRLRPLEDVDRLPVADSAPDLADLAVEQVVRDDIRRALRLLSPEHRAVVALHYYQGMSYKEIAEVTGSTVGTVGSRLHYAIRHLRRFMTDERSDEP